MNGLGTALITPFTTDGKIDFAALKILVDRQINANVDFLVVLGTTGEPATMTLDEKRSVLEAVLKQVDGRLPIVLGIGGNSTAHVIEEIEAFRTYFSLSSGESRGGAPVSAILSVCPYYNKPSQEGLYRHFCAIAKASPVPIIIYNVPGRTGVNMLPETIMRVWEAYPDKICAVKEATDNEEQIMRLITMAKGKLDVLSGNDNMAYQLISFGAAGLISVAANAWPKEYRTLVHEHKAYIQAGFEDMVNLLFRECSPAGIKTVLNRMGLCENVLRLPLVENSPEVQALIEAEMKNI